jgi:hypothetical protein
VGSTERSERPSRIRDDDHARTGRADRFTPHDDASRTPLDGGLDVVVPVKPFSLEGDEEIARLDRTGVRRDARE